MSYIIAIAGKGGTGKTTIASLLVRIIKEKKLGSILAIDADPNSNLGEVLGVAPGESIGTILDRIAVNPDKIPSGMTKDRFIEYEVQTAVAEGDGFDLLTMGRPEGPGCYCYVNNVLRDVSSRLMKDYDYVVIDNEAGLEHLSRRTMRCADTLLVISDATFVGLKAAGRINALAQELKIKIGKKFLLINRSSGTIDKDKIKDSGLPYIGNLPEDSLIKELSLSGLSLTKLGAEAESIKSLSKLGEKIWS